MSQRTWKLFHAVRICIRNFACVNEVVYSPRQICIYEGYIQQLILTRISWDLHPNWYFKIVRILVLPPGQCFVLNSKKIDSRNDLIDVKIDLYVYICCMIDHKKRRESKENKFKKRKSNIVYKWARENN